MMSGHGDHEELGARDGEVSPSPYIHDWVAFHAERRPASLAIASRELHLSYGDLGARVLEFAEHLAETGIEPGDRVLVALPNTPATVVATLAITTIGATSVEANRSWSDDTLAAVTDRSAPHHVILWARDMPRWLPILARHRITRVSMVAGGEPDPDAGHVDGLTIAVLLEDGRLLRTRSGRPRRASAASAPDSAALVLFTSGSTGEPLGVIQTFRNIDANTRSIVDYLGLTADDRAMLTLPLYYCYGRSVLQTHLLVGGSVILDNRMAFPRTVLESMAAERCTGFAGVPLTYEVIRRQVDVSSLSFPDLRYVTQAGGAMAPDTIAWARSTFAPARLFVMYGQTEATARLTYLPPEQAETKMGSVGIPIPGVELRVVDERGRDLPSGEIGELVARGKNITPGYLDDPLATSAILRDGWLWTGDLASKDQDGYFFHRGRAKEILKIGGHRVSPVEIEQVLARHPGVSEAAVIAMPDDMLGEVPWAIVVPAAEVSPVPVDILRFCRERLPPNLVPRRVITARALPRSESGKLQRTRLRSLVEAP